MIRQCSRIALGRTCVAPDRASGNASRSLKTSKPSQWSRSGVEDIEIRADCDLLDLNSRRFQWIAR